MADADKTMPREKLSQQVPAQHTPEPADVEIDLELRDKLPGGRAFIAVEQEGAVTWLADRHVVPAQAARDLIDEMRRMVRGRGWEQNWRGVS
ncbi:hypothetical protein [Streptomyces sp. NPDC003299]